MQERSAMRNGVQELSFFRNLAKNSKSTLNSDKLFFLGHKPDTLAQSSKQILWPLFTFRTYHMFQAYYLCWKTHLSNTAQHQGAEILFVQFKSWNLMNLKFFKGKTQVEMSSIPLLPTKSVWLCPSVETGAVYVTPRNNCLLLPCVLKVLS